MSSWAIVSHPGSLWVIFDPSGVSNWGVSLLCIAVHCSALQCNFALFAFFVFFVLFFYFFCMIWFHTIILKPNKYKNHLFIAKTNEWILAPFISIHTTPPHMVQQCTSHSLLQVQDWRCDTAPQGAAFQLCHWQFSLLCAVSWEKVWNMTCPILISPINGDCAGKCAAPQW